MPTFYSPAGNPEIWEEKPDGYFTPEEWLAAHPPEVPVPDPETERLAAMAELDRQLAALDADYYTDRMLADLAMGDKFAEAQYERHEELAEPLRQKRKTLELSAQTTNTNGGEE